MGSGEAPLPKVEWMDSYAQAMKDAKASSKMMLVLFENSSSETPEARARQAFWEKSLADADVQKLLEGFVRVRLPLDARIVIDGEESKLLDDVAFAEMQKRQGIAIIDCVDPRRKTFGHVVSAFPFDSGRYYSASAMQVILALPAGTLTQRTLIYAVRIHPEHPQSTSGKAHPVLLDGAESHSQYQASITMQGHQNWESRFHRLADQLPGGVLPVEVVAESWPGETLVEAAVDCVDSWRQSSGHWQAVSGAHAFYGFDMKRGSNGIWYATGILAGDR